MVKDRCGDPVPVTFQIGKQFGDIHAVHPCRTLIPNYLSVGFVEVLTVEYFFYHPLKLLSSPTARLFAKNAQKGIFLTLSPA
jgi:hypothetical protein